MPDLSMLRNAAVLRGLSDAQLEKLASVAYQRPAAKGDRLFTRDAESDTFYIVATGAFSLTVMLRWLGNPEEIAIEEKRPGDAFGWSALVAPFQSIYSAYCTESGSVIAFPREPTRTLLSADAELGVRFLSNLAELVGERARVAQNLWIDDVQQHSERVRSWATNATSPHWMSSMDPPRGGI